MPRISVIVPARDVVDYLRPCLDDLRTQTFEDLEVLVVDDGSTDGTPEVIDRVVAEDPRFRALSSGGGGPSAARNHGLEHASGEEIAFVDADDRLAPHYLERLHGSLARTGSDLACCNVRRLNGFTTTASGLHLRSIGESGGAATHLREQPQLVYDTTIWNKLFRRELWSRNGIRFPEGRWINDIYPSLWSHVVAGKVDVLTEVLYYWRVGTEQSPSITSRKFFDPGARLKSLADRFEALERSRRLLVDQLGDPAVRDRFDERVLWHDLLPYLVMFTRGDDVYRDLLVSSTGAFLRRHHIEPARYALGTLLHRVYDALFAADHEALGQLLDPRTSVTARAGRGRVHAHLPTPGAEPAPRYRRPLVRRGRRSRGRARLEATARVRRVLLEPTGDLPLIVSGSVRIRDGRSDVMGAWRVVVELEGRDTSVTISGSEAVVGEPTEHDVHPMLGNGWRPFVASADLAPTEPYAHERCWRVRLGLRHDSGRITPTTSYAAEAVRGLGGGRATGSAADLVPVPQPSGDLELRREAAPVRLRAVTSLEGGQLVLELDADAAAATTPDRLWLRQAGGGGPGAGTDSVTALPPGRLEARLDLGGDALAGADRWELWCRVRGERIRVRAAPTLRTTPVRALDPSRHIVLRPTVRGRVVLEAVERRLEVDELSIASDAAGPTIRVGGPATFPPAGPELLEVRCRWTGARLRTDLVSGPDRWRASLPVADVVGEIGGKVVPRGWSLHRVGPDGSTPPLHVPPGGRHRFPLVEPVGDLTARIEIGGASSAHLVVSPADGADAADAADGARADRGHRSGVALTAAGREVTA